MNNRQEFIKAGYHVLVWILAIISFAVYVKTTGKDDNETFSVALNYTVDKSAFLLLVPEMTFGLLLIGISTLFKIDNMVKTCREEFVSIFYTWWSALCAAMLFFAYYFYMQSEMVLVWKAVLTAMAGYVTFFIAFVPLGRWISQ